MFALEIDERQYYVTAKHIAKDITHSCDVAWEQGWRSFPVTLVGHCKGEIDITVLAAAQDLPRMLLQEWKSSEIRPDLKLAEELTFFGFPYGLNTSRGEGTVPIPLVKSGIISGFYGSSTLDERSSFFIDGYNNPGFSGGPVVSVRQGVHGVAGVVTGYLPADDHVYSLNDTDPTKPSVIGFSQYNTGIMLAYNIQYAVDVIKRNPIGRVSL